MLALVCMDRSSLYDVHVVYSYVFITIRKNVSLDADAIYCNGRRISFAYNLVLHSASIRWVSDMGLIKYLIVLLIAILGTVQES